MGSGDKRRGWRDGGRVNGRREGLLKITNFYLRQSLHAGQWIAHVPTPTIVQPTTEIRDICPNPLLNLGTIVGTLVEEGCDKLPVK